MSAYQTDAVTGLGDTPKSESHDKRARCLTTAVLPLDEPPPLGKGTGIEPAFAVGNEVSLP